MGSNSKSKKKAKKDKKMNYNPKDPRTCNSCFKKFNTEDGILERKGKDNIFNCADCAKKLQQLQETNNKDKAKFWMISRTTILILIIIGLVTYIIYKKNKTRDNDDDDGWR